MHVRTGKSPAGERMKDVRAEPREEALQAVEKEELNAPAHHVNGL